MSTAPSILKDLRNYLGGRVVLLLLGFATFPLITRMLSVSDYGTLSLSLRIVVLATVLSKCGMQFSVGRFYRTQLRESPREKQRFYSTLILGPLVTSLLVAAIYLASLLPLHGRLHSRSFFLCLLLGPALLLTRTLQSLLLGLLRNEGRSRLHSTLEVAAKVLTLAALVALCLGRLHTAAAVLTATIASEALVVLYQLVLLLRRRLLSWRAVHWPLLRTALVFGAPLIAYELASVVLDSGDRLMVRHYLGEAPLGFYSAAYNLSGYLQDTVMTPLNLAIFPIYIRLWNDEGPAATTRFLSRCLSWYIVAALALTALSMLCAHDAIVLLASARFAEAQRLLPILIPGLLLYGAHIFLNVGLVLQKKTATMALLVAASAGLNLLLNLRFIPRFGLTGAAWATLVSYAVLIAAFAAFNRRLLPLRADMPLITRALLASACAWFPAAAVHTPFTATTLLARAAVYLVSFALVLLAASAPLRAHLRARLSRIQLPLIGRVESGEV